MSYSIFKYKIYINITMDNKIDKYYLVPKSNGIHQLVSCDVGESKIIRTIGTCFAVGYTAGWA